MTSEVKTILGRIKRKLAVMRLDAKEKQTVVYNDTGELMGLIDLLEERLESDGHKG